MGNSGKKSSRRSGLSKLWRKALKEGVCPFAGCDIRKQTCKHLDQFLKDDVSEAFRPQISTVYTDDIDDFSLRAEKKESRARGAWKLYKDLKAYGVPKYMILPILDSVVLDKSLFRIAKDRDWSSYSTLKYHFRKWLKELKQRGFGG